MTQLKPSYLEEVLEAIKDFPKEMNDASTRLRELDLQVENEMDKQNRRMDEFFKKAQDIDPEKQEKLFQLVMQYFESIIDDADAKYDLASNMVKGLWICLDKIDDKITEFKMELEIGKPGITDIIERNVAAEKLSSPKIVQPNKKNTNRKIEEVTKKNSRRTLRRQALA